MSIYHKQGVQHVGLCDCEPATDHKYLCFTCAAKRGLKPQPNIYEGPCDNCGQEDLYTGCYDIPKRLCSAERKRKGASRG